MHDMFRPLLGYHQVSVCVKVLDLYPHYGFYILYNITLVTRHSSLCTRKTVGLGLDESLCIQLNAN
jgi:hypothetical protein